MNVLNNATKVGKSNVQMYESQSKKDSKARAQYAILDDAKIDNYSLDGASLKTKLYALFSIFAALELAAALFFYVMTFAVPLWFAIGIATTAAIAFHYLLHNALTTAAIGNVFAIGKHSNAAKSDVVTNTIIAVILCATAACIVYFIGKPSYITYRNGLYQTTKNSPQISPTNAQILQSNGTISTAKTKAVTALITTQNVTNTNDKNTYDNDTAKAANIVGTSAFVIELILLLLAIGIATAKRAATIDLTASNNGFILSTQTTINGTTNAQNANDVQIPNNAQNAVKTPQIGFKIYDNTVQDALRIDALRTNEKKAVCLQCETDYIKKTTWQKYCGEPCRVLAFENRTGKKIRRKTATTNA